MGDEKKGGFVATLPPNYAVLCVYLLFVGLVSALDDCLLLVVPFAEVVA